MPPSGAVRPQMGLHKGKRSNVPRKSEEEIRWELENQGEDIGKDPTW